MNIIRSIRDRNVFRPFLGARLGTWRPWLSALRALYGLPIKPCDTRIIEKCTGRDPASFTGDFDRALFLIGRRSGKSRVSSIIGAYEAILSGNHKKLARGEMGLVAVLAPTRRQAHIVRKYLQDLFKSTPMLANEVTNETVDGLWLRNGVKIEVLTGDYRSVRGFTLLAVIVDEAAFFGYASEHQVRSDTELIRAVEPGLATTQGRLIAISSPYAKKGWCWDQHRANFANENGRTLVWNCPSRTMNPTLPEYIVRRAMEEDLQAAKSEYLGEFRDDVAGFIDRAVVEALVARGVSQRIRREGVTYRAFADVSGGRSDDFALAIGHMEDQKMILDVLDRFKAPCVPADAVNAMCERLREFGLRHVVGDNYAAEWTASAFRDRGIRYTLAKKNKNQLYLELLPRLCSGQVGLLDNDTLVHQLSNLERRTRSGGRDVIDHPRDGHDDLANVLAGLTDTTSHRRLRIGALR